MIYFGIVENINDPLNAGRVQVRVYPFYREFAKDDLPWAYVERSTDLGPTNGRGLNMHNLMEGSQVTVEFLDKNMQSFVVHTIKFLNGSEITVDETPGAEYIKVLDSNKNFITLSTEGITIHVGDSAKKIQIEGAGPVNLTAGGDLSIKTSNNATIESSGNTTVKSFGNMKIESSGSTDITSSGETTIKAAKLNLNNILGKNQLCSLPLCLFTGKPHISPNSD